MKRLKYFFGAIACDFNDIIYYIKYGVWGLGHEYEENNYGIFCNRCGKEWED